MKIFEVLLDTNGIITNNLDADVYVQVGDFGPCVAYEQAGTVETNANDDWIDEGEVLISSPDHDDEPLKVSELIDKLSKLDGNLEVTVSDGFIAKPYLINSYREFADQEQRHAGYRINDATAKQYYGDKKYPLIIFDVEH